MKTHTIHQKSYEYNKPKYKKNIKIKEKNKTTQMFTILSSFWLFCGVVE